MKTSCPAPAKLNLMLRVTGRRNDGYHNLQTVFQFLDHGDWLHFRLRQDSKIYLHTTLPGIDNQDNLAVRAALLLQQYARVEQGIDIQIDKRLPMGAGLGGGSSNAATTLLVLNHLWNTHLNSMELAELGARLGADVPIFIHGQAAWAEGIGDELTPLTLPEPWYLVVIPDCQVSTAKIFCDSRLTRDAKPIKIRDFMAGDKINTCQPLVEALYPEVKEALQWLGQYRPCQMTGTGACIFAEFETSTQAQQMLELLPENMRGFVAKGCNRSPAHACLTRFTGAWPSG